MKNDPFPTVEVQAATKPAGETIPPPSTERPQLADGHAYDETLSGVERDGFKVEFATDEESIMSAIITARSTGSVGSTASTQKGFSLPHKLARVTRI